MANDKFNKAESSKFAPGGAYSTPEKRKTEASAGDFLMPTERKYPYKVNGKISCNLLRAAMSRAGQQGERVVESRAKKLYADHCEG